MLYILIYNNAILVEKLNILIRGFSDKILVDKLVVHNTCKKNMIHI